MAALMCVLSPISIPIGPVPISLATLVLYTIGALLYPLDAISALAIYLILGMMGLPVFSNFTGGIEKFLGPTGGFIVGYIPALLVESLMITGLKKKWVYPVSMVLATVVLYAFGLGWYLIMLKGQATFVHALMVCVVPFLLGDGIKIALSTVLGYLLRPALERQRQVNSR